jgi:trimeric autotransporter adhesin
MKTKKSFLCGAALFLGAAMFSQSVQAQLTLNGTNYIQNFDAISNGIPDGWSVRINATTNSLGTVTTNYNSGKKTWSDTSGEFGNCASTVANSGTNFIGNESTTVQGNCTNRALAVRQTGSFGDPGAAFVLQIASTIGLSNLTFSVDLCTLRTNGYTTGWTIQYAVGNSPASFTTLGAYSNSTVFGATAQTYNLGADANGASSNVWIRIVALSSATGSGSRATLGMDNFSLSWTTNGVSVTLPSISGITLTNGNVQIDFTGDSADSASAFNLQCVGRCSDVFGDTAANITQTSPGHFRAVCAMNGSQQFYRIKRP